MSTLDNVRPVTKGPRPLVWRRLGTAGLAVLETNGQVSFFTGGEGRSGGSEPPSAG